MDQDELRLSGMQAIFKWAKPGRKAMVRAMVRINPINKRARKSLIIVPASNCGAHTSDPVSDWSILNPAPGSMDVMICLCGDLALNAQNQDRNAIRSFILPPQFSAS
jgi:hypothetical protein